ncbi:hypothetical protein BAE44_0021580 [Dichanthelium oligosanthes]|uniref:KIB1-4 beta-propeller domain-containing protein n=1 Tax=Dichanthelium oligosanthes TaxID=888268 RepID=A0A1E5UX00_9POAL|nr:hypothetical protein BAE44_0021580 [Dichanthelium oligosanthes]
MAADVVGAGSPRLVLLNSLSNDKFFIADTETEQFYVVSLVTSADSVKLTPSLQCLDMSAESDAHKAALEVPIVSSFLVLRRLAVMIGPGEILKVRRSPQQGVCLFRVSSPGREMERVYSIGGRALFLGHRFISIHADSFPSINANCIYYKQKEEDGSTHIYMYDLAHDVEERIAEYMYDLSDELVYNYIYPASIIRLLVEYTVCSPRYKPAWDQVMKKYRDLLVPTEELIGMLQNVQDLNLEELVDSE